MKLNIEKLGWNLLLGSVLAISVAGVANAGLGRENCKAMADYSVAEYNAKEAALPFSLAWDKVSDNFTGSIRTSMKEKTEAINTIPKGLSDSKILSIVMNNCE